MNCDYDRDSFGLMRDNSNQLPEILQAYEYEGNFFCGIALHSDDAIHRFKFGVSKIAYDCLKKILSMRPFDQMPGINYQYFFVPAVTKREKDMVSFRVRIEQGGNGREFEFDSPRELAANLLWFFNLKDLSEASHLIWPS